MKLVIKRFFDNEKGLETVEYAIISGIIVVGIIATVAGIAAWVDTRFTALLTVLSG